MVEVGVTMVTYELDCGIVVTEFELLSRYYVHFQINTSGKSIKPLICPPPYQSVE